jgi:hypothetical protein
MIFHNVYFYNFLRKTIEYKNLCVSIIDGKAPMKNLYKQTLRFFEI